MKQATNWQGFRLDTLMPGIVLTTTPDDYAPIKALQPARFDGKVWAPFGDVVSLDGK